MTHPWRELPEECVVVTAALPAGERGRYYPEIDVIVLDPGLNQVQRRSTVRHEYEHRRHGGPSPAQIAAYGDRAWLSDRIEREVDVATAHSLISLEALGRALMLYGQDEDAVADELWVDVPTLRVRLKHLHPSERAWLRARLAEKEDGA